VNSPTQFYTVTEVADILKIYRKTVINWINAGILDGYKFKNSYRIRGEDLNNFINKSKIGVN